jgi:hypothetical protein
MLSNETGEEQVAVPVKLPHEFSCDGSGCFILTRSYAVRVFAWSSLQSVVHSDRSRILHITLYAVHNTAPRPLEGSIIALWYRGVIFVSSRLSRGVEP